MPRPPIVGTNGGGGGLLLPPFSTFVHYQVLSKVFETGGGVTFLYSSTYPLLFLRYLVRRHILGVCFVSLVLCPFLAVLYTY